ncbi:MAG: hypothetical protein ACI9RV_001162, partial [Glaciecola sp.]
FNEHALSIHTAIVSDVSLKKLSWIILKYTRNYCYA